MHLNRMAQRAQGFDLDLANAFARELEKRAQLFQSVTVPVTQTIAHFDDLALTYIQGFQLADDLIVESLVGDCLHGGGGPWIFQRIGQMVQLVVNQGSVERNRGFGHALEFHDPLLG